MLVGGESSAVGFEGVFRFGGAVRWGFPFF